MSITSLKFPFFVAFIAVVYYIIPKKFQWIWLLIISSGFYLNLSRHLCVYLAITIVSVYWLGLVMEQWEGQHKEKLALLKAGKIEGDRKQLKAANKKRKNKLIWACVILNLGMLVFLKFYNLIAEELNVRFGTGGIPILNLVLPLGISFYTFQAIGYLVDVYRGKQQAEHNFFRFALFMCFFPQMIQGPISRYHQLSPQFVEEHFFDYHKVCQGFQLF
ncbi:MAG: MBOAT family protein, partial [Lachnospiraceae bacterium]|nr:MBOAT family protein [Lachnospiraceae bacterium]